ncbi:uncharacterized protein LOC125189620 [Salvia hispanica]|uniref:uncharacterized protein LOC125189620 n=1 Tax=Salvia hispanica TaxID=49212 RepID=UPI0020092EA8|nr:uncharacterized protein LOC125189620 [Salvia hispanica]
MADSGSVDVILEFLKKNKFTKAEAALRSELGNRPDLNGLLQKLMLDDKESSGSGKEVNGAVSGEEDKNTKSARHGVEGLKGSFALSTVDSSKELIVKEVDSGTGRNESDNKWKNAGTTKKQSKAGENIAASEKNFVFSNGLDDTVLDLYSWKYGTSNGPVTPYQNDGGSAGENNFSGFQVPGKAKMNSAETLESGQVHHKSGDDASVSGEKRITWPGISTDLTYEKKSDNKVVDQQRLPNITCSKDDIVDNLWSRSDVSGQPSSEPQKECHVKTVFPTSSGDNSTSYDRAIAFVDQREGKRKAEVNNIRAAIKEQVDEVGRALFFGKNHGAEPKEFGPLEFNFAPENQREELPRLPPVRLKTEDKPFNIHWEEKYERDAPKILDADNAFLIGSFLDVPIGQEISATGKRLGGGNWLSVSQGITEDTSDLVSGFATIGDGMSESIDYPNEYWDSDEYEDDDDVGYMRQPIEDETWFLAHEIDYPSDNEKGTGHGSVPDTQERSQHKNDEDDQSFAEEDSYFSGERYIQSKTVNAIVPADDHDGLLAAEIYRRDRDNDMIRQYDGQLMDEEELKLMRSEPVWQGFVFLLYYFCLWTGFEEDKNFHVVLNSVIAGRYHVTEYLGSAAFSKAIQAHDLHTGMDVCVKIIKNNKDFFDQSLDEIKLLKYVNKHDPGDKYHLLRLYDYFYYREHLLIVCELLKANLYEFHKFNRESGGEVYFTMPRLQSITIQCLEALQFLHSLGLIHCDLKPENILVKSYSRCEVKVIDLGSSCFETDHLCSYVQSRSYRAPEVILGLPYGKKIDIWSLGCILAELCTGNVLFQNDSPATLLARVIGIIGSIEQGMLAKGRDTYKYFTKNHMLYERSQDSNRLEYLIPKKSSLRHRLPMGDQGFIDFVAHLLEVNPDKRPSASEALKHPWLQYPYEPISS